MIKFIGKSIDASYDKERFFLNSISGYGFKNSKDEAYIKMTYSGWTEIDPSTLQIVNVNDYED